MVRWPALLGGLSAAFAASMVRSAFRTRVNSHRLTVEGAAPLRLFFISDIHRRSVSARLIRHLRRLGAPFSAVVIGGDLAEGGVPEPRIRRNLTALRTLGPLYFAWGNNDREIGEQAMRRLLREADARVLDNCSFPLQSGWCIAGVDDSSSGNVDVAAAFARVTSNERAVFVAHNPFLFPKAAAYEPALVLGGHTHGGQIRLGRFGAYAPGSFRVSSRGGRLVSNGFGTTLVPLRLGAPAECHIIFIEGRANDTIKGTPTYTIGRPSI